MDKNLIITIFTPTKGDDGEGHLGTGFPIAEDLILTSRHVVQPEQRDPKQPIKVRWHYHWDKDDPDRGWEEISDDDIKWVGKGEVDAALIQCKRPESAQGTGWGILTENKPPSSKRWQSTGFPLATKCKNIREPNQPSGTTESMADKADYFELNVTSNPENEELWKGASGMPVFVDHEIFGVVRAVPFGFNAKKMYAVPVWQMFQDDKFRELLCIDKRKEYKKQIIQALTAILCADNAKSVAKGFSKNLGIEWKSVKVTGKIVAERLVNIWVESLIRTAGGI